MYNPMEKKQLYISNITMATTVVISHLPPWLKIAIAARGNIPRRVYFIGTSASTHLRRWYTPLSGFQGKTTGKPSENHRKTGEAGEA